jgi:hypothetical protein
MPYTMEIPMFSILRSKFLNEIRYLKIKRKNTITTLPEVYED